MISLTKAANYAVAVLLDDALRIYDGPVCEFVFKRNRGMLCLSFRCSCEYTKRLLCTAKHSQRDPNASIQANATQQAIRRLADFEFV